MIDRRPLHAEALADLDGLVSWVGASDLARPTPCAGWDLRRLVEHLVGQHRGFAAAVRGDDVEIADFGPRPIDGDDWRTTTWSPSVVELRDVFAVAELDRPVLLPELSPAHRFSVASVVSFHLVDTVAHCWDVATTLGVDYRPGDDLLDAFLTEARRVPAGDARTSPGAAFGPVVDTPGDAWTEGLGLLGRAVMSAPQATGRVGP